MKYTEIISSSYTGIELAEFGQKLFEILLNASFQPGMHAEKQEGDDDASHKGRAMYAAYTKLLEETLRAKVK